MLIEKHFILDVGIFFGNVNSASSVLFKDRKLESMQSKFFDLASVLFQVQWQSA
jgi:hypothetical protein